jgi:predicted DNA binding CopG/RHH family protein
MKRKINRTHVDEPVGNLRAVGDFLPAPENLLPKDHTIKVTVVLDEQTVKFFKSVAKKMGLKYQRMIREVLKGYAKKYG